MIKRLKLEAIKSERRAANDAQMHSFLMQMGQVMNLFMTKALMIVY